jgi:hypothetical protein
MSPPLRKPNMCKHGTVIKEQKHRSLQEQKGLLTCYYCTVTSKRDGSIEETSTASFTRCLMTDYYILGREAVQSCRS